MFPPDWPRWGVMWVLAFGIFAGCKYLTLAKCPRGESASFLWRLGYLFAWPGMDAEAFLSKREAVPDVSQREWVFALTKTLAGVVIYWGVARTIPASFSYLAGWIGMIGLILLLHFGLLHLLSCLWRHMGVNARPLMDWPFATRNISEFWGRRWNTAFRDLTYHFLFRPLTTHIGPTRALLLGFFISGLVHEVVITLPAGGGYGGPTFFFLLQGTAILVSRSRPGRRLNLHRGFRGWLFAMGILVVPVPLLFPPVFVHRIILPFMQFTGSSS